jgi:hypothetical protein
LLVLGSVPVLAAGRGGLAGRGKEASRSPREDREALLRVLLA